MVKQLHTPILSPQPSPWPSLSAEINAATRSQHTRLNRMIIERLPEALPPNKTNPGTFGSGLAPFADIFIMFESRWDAFIWAAEPPRSEHERMIHSLLSDLRPEGLMRSARLSNDLQHISDLTSFSLRSISRTHQERLMDGITCSINAKPHVLLAYGWVMYMAIFSGGRYIRQELSKAGPAFWTGVKDPEASGMGALKMPGFSFLSFDDEEDGEEIKKLFKAQFAQADLVLNEAERQDVVQAAQGIFDDCIAIIGLLDGAKRRQAIENVLLYILWCMMGAAIFLLYRKFWASLEAE